MSDIKDVFETLENFSKLEVIMKNLSIYNIARGGGILWIFLYWMIYFFSVYEISFVYRNIPGARIYIPNIIESIGFVGLFIMGCFVTYGVIAQLSLIRRFYIQQFNDYKDMVEKHINGVISIITEKIKLDIDQQKHVGNLYNSLQAYENKYFPKK